MPKTLKVDSLPNSLRTAPLERPDDACEHASQSFQFLVDNRQLGSRSSGLRYRNSPHIEDKDLGMKPITWGSLVWGKWVDRSRWVMTSEGMYLPAEVEGVPVLKEVSCGGTVEGTEKEARPGHLSLPLKVPASFELIPGDDVQRLLQIRGPGAWYQVVAARAAVRDGPMPSAKTIGCLMQGTPVVVFGWDESQQWRQCYEPTISIFGWMLLDHADAGPILRPKDLSLSACPLNPLCAAAAEGRLEDLRRFLVIANSRCGASITHPSLGELLVNSDDCGLASTRYAKLCARTQQIDGIPKLVANAKDAEGRGSLLLAAMAGHLECCVRLAEAGADAKGALEDAESRCEKLDVFCEALLLSFSGHPGASSFALKVALRSLAEEERHIAEAFFAQGSLTAGHQLSESMCAEPQGQVVCHNGRARLIMDKG